MTPLLLALRLGVSSPEQVCSLPPTDVGGVLLRVACPPATEVGDRLAIADPAQVEPNALGTLQKRRANAVAICAWGKSSCHKGWSSSYLSPVVTADVHILTPGEMDPRRRSEWMSTWRHELTHVSDCVNFMHRLAAVRADSCPHVVDAAGQLHGELAELSDRRDRQRLRVLRRRQDTPPPAE